MHFLSIDYLNYFDVYKSLFLSLPEDYRKTVKEIRQHLSDDEISNILSSPSHIIANQRIIATLLGRTSHGQDLFTFFTILESIQDAPALVAATKRFKES